MTPHHNRIALATLIACAACAATDAPPASPPPGQAEAGPRDHEPPAPETTASSARYIVDGNPVTAESWETLRSSLEGQHDWYCDDMANGGEEGWKGIDAQGQWYQVRMLSDETGSTNEITRLAEGPSIR